MFQGFHITNFEKTLQTEIEYRDGRVHPKHHVPEDPTAFDDSIPSGTACAPKFEQPMQNFRLMEGSDATFVTKVSGMPRPHVSSISCILSSIENKRLK